MVTMLSVLLMVQKSSQEQLDIKVIYQRESNYWLYSDTCDVTRDVAPPPPFPLSFLVSHLYILSLTVANILTRVVLDIDDEDCDAKSSQVAKYAMELLTGSLTQLPSDTPSQGTRQT